jgi:ferredoxin
MIPDVENQENLKEMEKLVEENHGGQVIPLEDAVKAVELAEGHECVLVPCYCRQYTGGIERMTCLWFYPVTRLVAESRQWEKHLLLSKEEAIEHLQQFDREGMVHLIEWGPVPIPLVICNCQWPYCWALRARLNYNVRNQPLKGEYLATVNPDSCDGCEGRPPCLARCQFGALRYIPEDEKVLVNLSQCFGCGVCRTSCPHQAISLLEKENVPGLKELW